MGLPEVLQMCCLSNRSGQITFRSGESYGFIFIQHGRVLHAMCGTIEGEEAIYTMLTWPGGGFSLNEDILPHKKTIALSWEQLLFEGARRADDGIVNQDASTGTLIPVTTAEPRTNRTQESQPKLTIERPDLPPMQVELSHEYTHLGRAPGNEIPLPYPSISNRHCIFILSGTDVVLRDLNSSNGTLVNGGAINEVILRPGDEIHVGVVTIKFEAGMKRPKLNPAASPSTVRTEPLNMESGTPAGSLTTVKLPTRRTRDPKPEPPKDDVSYVTGQSAISYQDLPKPEVEKEKSPWLVIGISIFVLALLGGACIYFFLLR